MWIQTIPSSGKERPAWIFLYVSVVQFVWGIILLIEGAQLNVPLAGLLRVVGSERLLGLALIVASSAGVIARWKRVPPVDMIIYVVPQQIFLILAVVAGFIAVIKGQYADGIVRSRAFILSDQLPLIVGGIIHTVALVDYCTGLLTHKWGVPVPTQKDSHDEL